MESLFLRQINEIKIDNIYPPLKNCVIVELLTRKIHGIS